ncbi:FtsX-like permease family protein [Occultella kanbiaonis]|uniref:FtsX-like permease family protein n=1 Tax=Occultella kanbiaonis TaxID=2675754 RepID=UPI002E2E4587|nr:FtsX-like permease family protein [Occultella kanbiaonis]
MPAVGVALLLNLVTAGDDSLAWSTERLIATLVGGALLAGIGIAAATPVLADAGAVGLLRTRRVSAVLAARGIQAEPLATTRLVAGLAVALYLVLGGSAVLLAFETTPQYRSALQALGEGPQRLAVGGGDWEEYAAVTLEPAELQEVENALAAVPGVLMVTPIYELQLVGCDEYEPRCHPQFFVGTCDELGQVMVVSGCSDDRPGFITAVNPSNPNEFWEPERLPGDPDITVTVTGGGDLTLHLGPDLTQDVAATEERWVYQNQDAVFVPEHLVEATGVGAHSLQVVAVGGTEIRDQITATLPDGTFLYPSFNDSEVDSVARVRLVIYTLSAMAIGTALLGLALTTIDHARERRQVVARQLAVGMPARTLYSGLLLQALIPLVAALALATGLGWLAVQAWAAASGWPPLANAQTVGLVGTTTALGGLLVALATVPAARTRLTATLLRRE